MAIGSVVKISTIDKKCKFSSQTQDSYLELNPVTEVTFALDNVKQYSLAN